MKLGEPLMNHHYMIYQGTMGDIWWIRGDIIWCCHQAPRWQLGESIQSTSLWVGQLPGGNVGGGQ